MSLGLVLLGACGAFWIGKGGHELFSGWTVFSSVVPVIVGNCMVATRVHHPEAVVLVFAGSDYHRYGIFPRRKNVWKHD